MARALRLLFPGAYYHVTCRGNERKAVFRDDTDRSVFLEKLKKSIEIYGVRLHAYVMMDNHFHLIVETPGGNLSEFMRHFNIVYTAAFNRRHKRVGHLYQGRYKAILIDQESYLLELTRHVHVNPVRVRRAGEKEDERWWMQTGTAGGEKFCGQGAEDGAQRGGAILRVRRGET